MDNCIFCGESFGPDRKRSKEHAAAKWCGKIVPSQGVGHHILVVETADGVTQEDRGLRDPFTTTAGGICAPCNNGWMEEMEDWAERWLTAPITGNERTLRYWRQALAATWAVKTAMVWESVAPKNRTIPLEVLRMFHRFQRPGARQQVWVGRYSGSDPIFVIKLTHRPPTAGHHDERPEAQQHPSSPKRPASPAGRFI